MKRLPTVMSIAGLVIGLTGCGGGGSSSDSSASRTSRPTVSAQTSTTTATSPVPTADAQSPAVGTELATDTSSSGAYVLTSGSGFSLFRSAYDIAADTDRSTLTTYDAAGQQLSELSSDNLNGDCGAADVQIKGGLRLILTEIVTTQPAQGVTPESGSTTLKAWDARTGDAVWSTTLPGSDGRPCSANDRADNGGLKAGLLTFPWVGERRFSLSPSRGIGVPRTPGPRPIARSATLIATISEAWPGSQRAARRAER